MAAVDAEQLKADLKQAFDKVDADQDGKISHDDLKAVLQEAGFEGNDDNVQQIISNADMSGDGVIDFEEFAVAMISVGIAVRITMFLRRAFAAMDTDESGYITPSDIRTLVDQAGIPDVSDSDIEELIQGADTSGDGKVSFEEFAVAIGNRIQERMAE